MKKSTMVVALVLTTVLAFGCGREETAEAPAETTTVEQPGMGGASDVSPMNAQTWIDDFTIGSELGADGSMVPAKTGDDFAPGQAIHIAMEVGDAPATSPVMVVWYGPNETKIGEETKTVTAGQKYLTFTATDTKSWAKGDYRAEVWVGDEKVNSQQFNITDPSKAAS